MRSRHQYKTILKKCCMKIWHFRFLPCDFLEYSREKNRNKPLWYNLDKFTRKQIKLRRTCEWLGPGYTSINSRKNAFNPYNSVTKYFFSICFENLPLGIPSTHTYNPLVKEAFNINKNIYTWYPFATEIFKEVGLNKNNFLLVKDSLKKL